MTPVRRPAFEKLLLDGAVLRVECLEIELDGSRVRGKWRVAAVTQDGTEHRLYFAAGLSEAIFTSPTTILRRALTLNLESCVVPLKAGLIKESQLVGAPAS